MGGVCPPVPTKIIAPSSNAADAPIINPCARLISHVPLDDVIRHGVGGIVIIIYDYP